MVDAWHANAASLRAGLGSDDRSDCPDAVDHYGKPRGHNAAELDRIDRNSLPRSGIGVSVCGLPLYLVSCGCKPTD